MAAWGVGIISSLLLSGCAAAITCNGTAPNSMEVVATDDASRAALQSVPFEDQRCWAASGNQFSQYLTGFAYEYGVGTVPDRTKAIKAYKQAAARRSNQIYVYSPAVGKETSGRVIPVSTGPATPGLPEAKAALERLGE